MKSCLLLVLLALATPADVTLVQSSGPARLLVKGAFENGAVPMRFSEMLEVIVEIDSGAGENLEVSPPPKWTLSPGWKIKDVSRPTVKTLDKGRRWRQTFLLDPLAPGVQQVVLEMGRYRNAGEPWRALAFRPFTVTVTPHVHDGDLNNLREQTPIEELPPGPRTVSWAILALAGLGALVLVAAWLVLHRRAQGPRQLKAPVETALYELKRLKALELPHKGKAEDFHTLLANVVRRFLEKQYDLPARRMTTPEFSHRLEKVATLPADQKEFVLRFLERCDLAKFAGKSTPLEDCAELERQAWEFVRRCATEGKRRSLG
jgi:hypothetical protein